jgi:hypothetical protein
VTVPHRFKRRTLLAGASAGALLAPFSGGLHALLGSRVQAQQGNTDNLLLISWPFGLDSRWMPKGEGNGYELVPLGDDPNPLLSEPILKTLVERHRERLLVVSGMRAGLERSVFVDSVGPAAVWTGWNGEGAASEGLSPLVSVDQIIAERLSGNLPCKSIHAGVDCKAARTSDVPPTYYHWAAPGQGIQPVSYPSELFQQLADWFGDRDDQSTKDLAVADYAAAEAERLAMQLDADSRARFDSHLVQLRDRRASLASMAPICAPLAPDSSVSGDNARLAANAPAVTKAHAELLAMAFRCGLTKVATLQLAPDRGEFVVPYAGATTTVHFAAQGGDDEAPTRAISSRYFMDRLADVLDVLEATDMGNNQTLLDQTLVVMSSEEGTPRGLLTNVPVFIAGGSQHFFRRAKHIALSDEPKVSRLLVTLLRAYGFDTDTIGNITTGNFQGPIAEIMR